jgi:hypothetical protein
MLCLETESILSYHWRNKQANTQKGDRRWHQTIHTDDKKKNRSDVLQHQLTAVHSLAQTQGSDSVADNGVGERKLLRALCRFLCSENYLTSAGKHINSWNMSVIWKSLKQGLSVFVLPRYWQQYWRLLCYGSSSPTLPFILFFVPGEKGVWAGTLGR